MQSSDAMQSYKDYICKSKTGSRRLRIVKQFQTCNADPYVARNCCKSQYEALSLWISGSAMKFDVNGRWTVELDGDVATRPSSLRSDFR